MADLKTIFDKTEDKDGWVNTHNEIIDRISALTIDCPECENIIHDDEQYQCGTCNGGSKIFVLDWIKKQISDIRPAPADKKLLGKTIFDVKLKLRIAKDESHKDKFTQEFITEEIRKGNAIIERGSSSNFVKWLMNKGQIMAEVLEVK